MKEVLISFFVCLVVGAFINGLPVNQPKSPTATEPDATTKEIPAFDQNGSGIVGTPDEFTGPAAETTDEKFDQDVLACQTPVLVDFSASWCGPCQRMAPVMDQLAEEYSGKLKVLKVDIDRNPALKSRYGIHALPTFMLFANGGRLGSFTGAAPKEAITALINRELSALGGRIN